MKRAEALEAIDILLYSCIHTYVSKIEVSINWRGKRYMQVSNFGEAAARAYEGRQSWILACVSIKLII